MTGFMHEKEFSRKAFVKGGGGLIIGFSALGAMGAGKAAAASGNTPFASRTAADFLPNLQSVDSWIAITPENGVIVTHGETEFAGTPTGILMLVAEELNISDMSMMTYAHPETWLNATGGGGGSGGISSRSTQTRAAAAYGHQVLLGMASTQLGVPQTSLTSANGVITGGGKSVKFSDLLGGKLFNFVMPLVPQSTSASATQLIPGAGITKPVSSYTLVGTQQHRIDIPAKVMGTYTYIQNVRVAGMLHGRRVRPRGTGAIASQNHYPLSVDASSIKDIPGAQVVQVNNWLGVVAPKEYDAIQAAAQLKVVWKSDPKFNAGGSADYWSWLRTAGDTNTINPPRIATDTGGVPTALTSSAHTVSATYKYQYNNFVPIGPHCAVADIYPDGSGGIVYAQGQSINGIPASIQMTLQGLPNSKWANTPAANYRVIWYEGSASYGGGQQGEAAEEAALMSAVVGKPVRNQWMRWDQTGWDHYGPSQMYDVTMGSDANGKITVADWVGYSQSQTNLDRSRELLGEVTWPAVAPNGGPTPSDTGVYGVTGATGYGASYQYQRRVTLKTQPLYGGALCCNFLRAPNAPQSYFASEQIVDELAHSANMDPIAFRRANIDGTTVLGQRWLSVMDAATLAAGWKPRVAASNLQSGNVVSGRGFGFGTFASSQVALVADVQVNKKTGAMVAKHVWIAQNNGITVSLEGVTSQMSGALIQGLSRAMWEQATWNTERVTSLDWVSYPILRFKDHPSVTLVNVHPGQYVTVTPGATTGDVRAGNTAAFNEGWLLTGSGEPPTSAISSAMANAFFDATGVRVRQAPMRPEIIRGALKAASA
ncbi:MAG TPA: molybdopterin cofactor-binding domain-containing protein [Gaiellaceae bacterium]